MLQKETTLARSLNGFFVLLDESVFERTVGSYEVRTGFYLQCFYLVVEVI